MTIAPPKGPGRPKGSPNKATKKARDTLMEFVEGNAELLQEWLNSVATGVMPDGTKLGDPNPEKAFMLFNSVIEYCIPKLARTELANPDGETFKTSQELEKSDKEIIERFLANKK